MWLISQLFIFSSPSLWNNWTCICRSPCDGLHGASITHSPSLRRFLFGVKDKVSKIPLRRSQLSYGLSFLHLSFLFPSPCRSPSPPHMYSSEYLALGTPSRHWSLFTFYCLKGSRAALQKFPLLSLHSSDLKNIATKTSTKYQQWPYQDSCLKEEILKLKVKLNVRTVARKL